MKFILGKKIEMTQLWRGDKVIPVTKVGAGPCLVLQVKNKQTDGYAAVQLGFGQKKPKNINKPQQGHLEKYGRRQAAGGIDLRYLREFRLNEDNKKQLADLKSGDQIDVSTFAVGDEVKVTGISKGKGFQGVVKRHGFSGAPKSHGTKDQLRMPGSIGATGPAHVFKGRRMPGRMGGEKSTVANLEIIDIDQANNLLYIKGAVPGARNGLILIQGEGELKISAIAMAADEKQTAKEAAPIAADKKQIATDEKQQTAEEGARDEKVESKK